VTHPGVWDTVIKCHRREGGGFVSRDISLVLLVFQGKSKFQLKCDITRERRGSGEMTPW
jgi:hypothetical protein